MKKVLIVTYYWPPGSGAGVQRWLKFSKYLPLFGWEPVILTVKPEFASYPALDKTLEGDIPAGLRVYRTSATDYFRLYRKDKSKIPSAGFASGDEGGLKSKIIRFIRGNFFIPDPRRGWNKFAFREACSLIENEKISHVITTSPPHSTQLIGLKLKKRFPGITWTADLRDPWTDIYYYSQFYHTLIAKKIDACYEEKVLIAADKIITVGKSLKKHFSLKAAGLEEKIEIITNGFDEDDFKNIQTRTPEAFTISYIGTLSVDYPISGFLTALRELVESGQKMIFRFVGIASETIKKQILGELDASNIEFIAYTDHSEAINYMTRSSALLLIIPDHKSNRGILTGKLFEYLATGRPVICLGPHDGDAAEIIKECSGGRVFGYDDSRSIREFLFDLIGNPILPQSGINSFSRQNLTEKLAQAISK